MKNLKSYTTNINQYQIQKYPMRLYNLTRVEGEKTLYLI